MDSILDWKCDWLRFRKFKQYRDCDKYVYVRVNNLRMVHNKETSVEISVES
jgi:hypothetical protein